jgi:capsular exopolysaccharide synthesis family protein
MELKDYIMPLGRWWWLLMIATVVSTLSSFGATFLEEPLYQTKAALMIGQGIEDANPNSSSLYLTQQLALSYVELAKRPPVQQATMDALGLTWLPDYEVNIVANTQLLEISVIDTNALRAQAVANTLAAQLVLQSPTGDDSAQQEREAFVTQQLDSLEAKIASTEAEIARLQEEMAGMISARQIADTQSQVATLETLLNTFQTNYGNLLATTDEGAINTLRIVEPAPLPVQSINDGKLMTILLGAAIGFTLAAGAAYLMEYLDNTLKTPEEIAKAFGLPLIGFLGEAEAGEDDESLIVVSEPRSAMAEAFRMLRTNLEFAAVDHPLRTILITGPEPGSGKTTVATNLALSIVQAGKKVLLLDADLRRPRVHELLGISRSPGFTDIFRETIELDDAIRHWGDRDALSAVTSGDPPPNPTELLGSPRTEKILAEIREAADVVVVDSPPFVVVDAAILAARVDGVVLVLRPGRTTEQAVKAMLEQLERAEARLLGVVINRIPRRGGTYYGSYRQYYAPQYYAASSYENGQHSNSNGQGAGQKQKKGSRSQGRLRLGAGK